jgi:hypothetical protein
LVQQSFLAVSAEAVVPLALVQGLRGLMAPAKMAAPAMAPTIQAVAAAEVMVAALAA